jgi:hypothetical protein
MAMAEKSAAHPETATSSAASRMEVAAAEPPEASHRAGQFGPLPSVIRPIPPADGKRDRRGNGNGGGRATILVWLTAILLAAGLAWAFATAFAQQPKPADPKPAAPAKNGPATPPKSQQQQQQQAQQQPSMPVSTEQALYLIRSTLLTLNDANRSGNYTVLRDLAAPDFQARNTAADLSQSFSDLRRRNFDLYGAALLSPQLTVLPALDQKGFLHLAGYFPTRPQQINFDLLFQNVVNQWRLFGISIATPEAPAAGR